MSKYESVFQKANGGGGGRQRNTNQGRGRNNRNNNQNNNNNQDVAERLGFDDILNGENGYGVGPISVDDVARMEKELERNKKRIATECTHRSKNGRDFNFEYTSNPRILQCRTCKTTFDIATLSTEELQQSAFNIRSAIEQMRMNLGTSAKDAELSRVFGKTGYEVSQIPEMYERLRNANKGGRRRNNRRRGNDFSGYGHASEILSLNR